MEHVCAIYHPGVFTRQCPPPSLYEMCFFSQPLDLLPRHISDNLQWTIEVTFFYNIIYVAILYRLANFPLYSRSVSCLFPFEPQWKSVCVCVCPQHANWPHRWCRTPRSWLRCRRDWTDWTALHQGTWRGERSISSLVFFTPVLTPSTFVRLTFQWA